MSWACAFAYRMCVAVWLELPRQRESIQRALAFSGTARLETASVRQGSALGRSHIKKCERRDCSRIVQHQYSLIAEVSQIKPLQFRSFFDRWVDLNGRVWSELDLTNPEVGWIYLGITVWLK